MFPLPPATTVDLTLDAVLTRLSRHPAVAALVTVGSTGREVLTPVSDYDVLIILSDMPVALHVGITYIDHRLTDLLFATTAQVEQVLTATESIDGDSWTGRIVRWLMTGTVVFDRHGRVRQAQAMVMGGRWIRPLDDVDAYGAWFGVNYNLLHTRRLMQSSDPLHRSAAELRMSLYGVGDIVLSYFRVRKLLWEGDKAAIRHLLTHDPPFLALLQHFLREADPERKFARYEQLAAATLAPISPLWDDAPTGLLTDMPPASWATVAQSLAFWEALLHADSTDATSDR